MAQESGRSELAAAPAQAGQEAPAAQAPAAPAGEAPSHAAHPPAPSSGHGAPHGGGHVRSGFGALALGSLGVVFGDIGTSPLYALKESLHHIRDGATDEAVIGTVSLLIFALFFTVTAKYVLFLMHADNKGEGGTLSLMALAQRALGHRAAPVFFLGVAGAALFSGDAIITPAISVLSALEGLELVTPVFTPYILPATIVILISIFWVQSHGSGHVAVFFGPVMAVFFLSLGVLGALHIHDSPRILLAFDPMRGLRFLFGHGVLGFIVLGSVFLAVTGAEALYADMGHFGRLPIQAAWLFFVLPSLVLNYLGQGALVLSNPGAVENPFFLMAPPWALPPLVLLATMATVIASQAVITGAFSLARQAIQLGLLPRMLVLHTSETQEGQIYLPRVNRLLLIGVLILVLMFKSSSALASAYGIAVTCTMVVTTLLAFVVVWKYWNWPLWLSVLFVSAFLVVDLSFLAANLVKVIDGGWVPLLLAVCAMICMWTWVRGSDLLTRKTRRDSISMRDLVRMLEKSKPLRVSGTGVFLTNSPEIAPSAFMHNLKHNKVMHERVLLMSVKTEETPRVPTEKRFEIEKISDDFTSVVLHFGFMESPRIPTAMAGLRKAGLKFDIMTTSFFVGRRKIKPAPNSGMPMWQDKLFIALFRQSANPTDYFSIPSDRVVELGEQLTI
ncbi:potassium transporter Kup [Methylocella sp.]|uniref:potassium transporter Kup n=1 Tax=Methylocella sp. TaxID=1978226 RepID=UPI0035AE48BA